MPQAFSYTKVASDPHTRARAGIIHTPHGDIQTPAFVPVGTQGSVKSLTPEDLAGIGTQIWFNNTYHLYLRPGTAVVKSFGGLHGFTGWKGPLITDSGGFQVFSLGAKRLARLIGDVEAKGKSTEAGVIVQLVRIDDEGVTFQSHWDGTTHRFTPEISLEIQADLGADIVLVFDECTPYPTDGVYARLSLDRTHRWAERSLLAHEALQRTRKKENLHPQAIYGIIQGSIYEDLRKESAEFIRSLPFDGFGIGGVSVGETKSEMRIVADWVVPMLPKDKPRHLLGVGEIDDIFALVRRGIDTFDCVQPTRLARAGYAFTHERQKKHVDEIESYTMDLNKSELAFDTKPLDVGCVCYACTHFTRAYIHHLLRVKELLAYRLVSIHNIAFIHALTTEIRASIVEGTFVKLEKQWGY